MPAACHPRGAVDPPIPHPPTACAPHKPAGPALGRSLMSGGRRTPSFSSHRQSANRKQVEETITMTAGISNMGQLLEALREWLLANPDGNIQDFAAQHDTTPQELTEGWNNTFNQADFSRHYNLDTAQSG